MRICGDAHGVDFGRTTKTVLGTNWQSTVYYGLPRDLYQLHPNPGHYLAFLGRLALNKRPDHAIELAKRVGIPLRIAGKIDPEDEEYFRVTVKPLLADPLIDYLGEITEAEKRDFLGQAMALVCPYDWPEPFELVLIEALRLERRYWPIGGDPSLKSLRTD